MFMDGKWRQALHLEPPRGWLNDPNGLCFFGGFYHVYFQYAPDQADGSGKKCWGHYQSRDFLHWEFTGTVLFPDIAEDKDGVYSGCAVVHDDTLHLFYTGNVKHAGNYDYINSGREANVIHVYTRDGIHMSEKQIVLRNEDYPSFCSCHVRDPKVWCENGKWKMVLGARTRDDKGCVLFYESLDLENWHYDRSDAVADFGYMWECPDCFDVDGHRYLSLSPQGMVHTETAHQNIYSSGCFQYDNTLTSFEEWDKGFDFYAPQTFEAPDGRRILIGWMGIGDIPYANPTTALGYQHCLTLPREITRAEDGTLRQNPIQELAALRGEAMQMEEDTPVSLNLPFDMVSAVENPFSIRIDNAIELCWDRKLFCLRFLEDNVGCGRSIRRAKLDICTNIRVVADKSALEIYLNDGRIVFSTRMYPEEDKVKITAKGIAPLVYPLRGMEVNDLGE